MKKLLLSLIILTFISSCATSPEPYQLDTKSDFTYALEALARDDYEAGYRLLESYFSERKFTNPENTKVIQKTLHLLKHTPKLLSAAKSTYTKKSFQETVKRHSGIRLNAKNEEIRRLAIYKKLMSFKIVDPKEFMLAVNNFKSFFKKTQLLPNKKAAKYIWSAAMRDRLYALSLRMDKSILSQKTPCQGKAHLLPISFAILQAISFEGQEKNPTKGIWTFRYKFDRCGKSSIYNAVFRAKKSHPADVFPLPPGTTNLSLTLMKDIKQSLYFATILHNKDDKNCKKMIVTDTKITRKPSPIKVKNKTVKGVWEEKWSIRTCTGIFNINYCFIPRGSGGITWAQKKCTPSNIETAISVN